MNPIKSIEEELADCRAAWEANPAAKFAWCCHHEVLVEPLVEPFGNRIAYMLAHKSEREQAVRFRNFRPARVALSDEFVKAGAEYHKAVADRDKAWAEYRKAWAEYYRERAEYDKALVKHQDKLTQLHREDWPDTTWNGQSIFEK